MRTVVFLLLGLSSCSPSRAPGRDAQSTASGAVATDASEREPASDGAPAAGSARPRTGPERFAKEPRDEAFAVPREELYASVFPVVRRKLPGLTLHAVCKQTICKIVARIPAELAPDPDLPEIQRLPWGDRVTVVFGRSDPTQVVVELYSVLEGPMADIDYHRALFDQVVLRPSLDR